MSHVSNTAIGFAVIAFYFLDFSLNALQASLRNLLLDVTPPTQLNSGNAWHGRMTHAGNIVGYGFGKNDFPILLEICLKSMSRFLAPCSAPVTPLTGRRSIQKILYCSYGHFSCDSWYHLHLSR